MTTKVDNRGKTWYYDAKIGWTMSPIYWVDGAPSFVPPHLHEEVAKEAIAVRFGVKPTLLGTF